MREHAGQTIEIIASVVEAADTELPLTAFDVVGEIDAPVLNTSNVASETPVSTSGAADLPEAITLKLEVSRIRQVAAGSCQ
jgi:hypothetical protein